jgi:hypothetical protein
MGFFLTPAEKARKKQEEEARRREAEFAASPAGQARAAKAYGMTIFQIDVLLSGTGGYAGQISQTRDSAAVIQSIENQGWRLEHAGYVYRVTGSENREMVRPSGIPEKRAESAVSGEIVGIYIFRASAA